MDLYANMRKNEKKLLKLKKTRFTTKIQLNSTPNQSERVFTVKASKHEKNGSLKLNENLLIKILQTLVLRDFF